MRGAVICSVLSLFLCLDAIRSERDISAEKLSEQDLDSLTTSDVRQDGAALLQAGSRDLHSEIHNRSDHKVVRETGHVVFQKEWKLHEVATHQLRMRARETTFNPTSSVTVLSMFTGTAIDALAVARTNHNEYCSKHGYTYIAPHTNEENNRYLNGRKGGWAKVALLQQVFANVPEGAFVFWMDGDSLFMDKSHSLQYFVDGEHDIVIAGDENGLNTGHFLIRNTQWSRNFIDGVWKIFPAMAFQYEQSSFVAMIGGANPDDSSSWKPSFQKLSGVDISTESGVALLESRLDNEMRKKVKILVQSSMNSNDWHRGDFIFHVAGGADPCKKASAISALASSAMLEFGFDNGPSNCVSELATKKLLERYAKLAE